MDKIRDHLLKFSNAEKSGREASETQNIIAYEVGLTEEEAETLELMFLLAEYALSKDLFTSRTVLVTILELGIQLGKDSK